MCVFIQPIMMTLVAGAHHGLSTELPGLLGALLRIASPSVDLVEQMKLHLVVWRGLAEVVTRRIHG